MTTAESISNFINWAEQRIAKEYEENERLEEEHGKMEYPDAVGRIYGLNDEDRMDIIEEVDYFKSQGYKLSSACVECNIHTTTYLRWKRELKDKYKIIMPKYKK